MGILHLFLQQAEKQKNISMIFRKAKSSIYQFQSVRVFLEMLNEFTHLKQTLVYFEF